MVDGVKGVDRAVLIRTSMGASRRSVKKRQVLSQSLWPSARLRSRRRVSGTLRSLQIESVPVDPDIALSPKAMRCLMKQPGTAQEVQLFLARTRNVGRAKFVAYRDFMGWTPPWYSTAESALEAAG